MVATPCCTASNTTISLCCGKHRTGLKQINGEQMRGPPTSQSVTQVGIVLNYCQYGVLYLGSYYNTGPYIHFPHFGNSNLGKLPGSMLQSLCLIAIDNTAHSGYLGSEAP